MEGSAESDDKRKKSTEYLKSILLHLLIISLPSRWGRHGGAAMPDLFLISGQEKVADM